ncbi:hypothetical protein KY284_001786 [Solanum tuberosum]|nr:hypothetical protein KY284_001786 [Solanum tuberosum]
MVYTDGRGEYIGLKSTLLSFGIQHLISPPYTPQLVGTVERKHRHIVDTALTLLHHAFVPLKFWSLAFQSVVYLINRLPTPLFGLKSSFQCLFNTTPNPLKLRVFGCLCYPWLKPYTSTKLDPKSNPCVFMEYSAATNSYACLDLATLKVYISRHVVFVEHIFPFTTNYPQLSRPQVSHMEKWLCPDDPSGLSSSSQPVSPVVADPIPTPNTDLVNSTSTHGSQTQGHLDDVPTGSIVSPPTYSLSFSPSQDSSPYASPQPTPATPSNQMVTRSQNNIFKPKVIFDYLATSTVKHISLTPNTFSQASKYPEWQAAMAEEHMALLKNKTWPLVPSTPSQNVVGVNWCFVSNINLMDP